MFYSKEFLLNEKLERRFSVYLNPLHVHLNLLLLPSYSQSLTAFKLIYFTCLYINQEKSSQMNYSKKTFNANFNWDPCRISDFPKLPNGLRLEIPCSLVSRWKNERKFTAWKQQNKILKLKGPLNFVFRTDFYLLPACVNVFARNLRLSCELHKSVLWTSAILRQ